MQNIKIMTLFLVIKESKILLGMKKRGFGIGKWNGFGGKVNPDETVIEGAKRELFEECQIKPINPKFLGFMIFNLFGDDKRETHHIHIFLANDYEGEVSETEEMKPSWFDLNNIPYSLMWADDIYWYPLLISGKLFFGKIDFSNMNTMINHEFQIIDSIENLLKIQYEITFLMFLISSNIFL